MDSLSVMDLSWGHLGSSNNGLAFAFDGSLATPLVTRYQFRFVRSLSSATQRRHQLS